MQGDDIGFRPPSAGMFGLTEDYLAAQNQAVQQIGANIRNAMMQVTVNNDVKGFAQDIQSLNPTDPEFGTKAFQIAVSHPHAIQTPGAQRALNMLGAQARAYQNLTTVPQAPDSPYGIPSPSPAPTPSGTPQPALPSGGQPTAQDGNLMNSGDTGGIIPPQSSGPPVTQIGASAYPAGGFSFGAGPISGGTDFPGASTTQPTLPTQPQATPSPTATPQPSMPPVSNVGNVDPGLQLAHQRTLQALQQWQGTQGRGVKASEANALQKNYYSAVDKETTVQEEVASRTAADQRAGIKSGTGQPANPDEQRILSFPRVGGLLTNPQDQGEKYYEDIDARGRPSIKQVRLSAKDSEEFPSQHYVPTVGLVGTRKDGTSQILQAVQPAKLAANIAAQNKAIRDLNKAQVAYNADRSDVNLKAVSDAADAVAEYKRILGPAPSQPAAPVSPQAAAPAQSSDASKPVVSTQEDYDALQDGQSYIDPHGVLKVKGR